MKKLLNSKIWTLSSWNMKAPKFENLEGFTSHASNIQNNNNNDNNNNNNNNNSFRFCLVLEK